MIRSVEVYGSPSFSLPTVVVVTVSDAVVVMIPVSNVAALSTSKVEPGVVVIDIALLTEVSWAIDMAIS